MKLQVRAVDISTQTREDNPAEDIESEHKISASSVFLKNEDLFYHAVLDQNTENEEIELKTEKPEKALRYKQIKTTITRYRLD